MARYPLNLPSGLKEEAERLASSQGVSLNQFILWAVAEKVGILSQAIDDPAFPLITHKRGPAGDSTPIIKGTGIRVQTILVAATVWAMPPEEIAQEWSLTLDQVRQALAFYCVHKVEVDANIAFERAIEQARE
ncbi:MAG: DUF433 domain-containing protein [Chloroflexi bacterium]|nr:DUF433 domain-containing protein [Chloroflexota bacterium]